MMFKRGKLISYDARSRTAKVHIYGLTDGASDGLTATFAYPVGDDDRDTEREIVLNNDVYVFFENDEQSRPVIAFYSSHGKNNVVDIRRIRQENIEILARAQVTVEAPTVHIKGNVIIDGNVTHNGDLSQSGSQHVGGSVTATGDVKAGSISLKGHKHTNVKGGFDTSGGAI